ncbi:hypothetical protein VCHA53O466_50004 [Vibrio chagasii]|nr:hypothetical protein VCHA53O466_50004 [Vibrio chagasii]
MPIFDESKFKTALALSKTNKITKGSIKNLRTYAKELPPTEREFANMLLSAANLMERDLGSRAGSRPTFKTRVLQQNRTDDEKQVAYAKSFGACAGVKTVILD